MRVRALAFFLIVSILPSVLVWTSAADKAMTTCLQRKLETARIFLTTAFGCVPLLLFLLGQTVASYHTYRVALEPHKQLALPHKYLGETVAGIALLCVTIALFSVWFSVSHIEILFGIVFFLVLAVASLAMFATMLFAVLLFKPSAVK